MKKYIAFLRGINVGGKRKILMKDLQQLLVELNLSAVKTYIQSGNVVFQADKSIDELVELIEKEIVEMYEFEVSVVIKEVEQLKEQLAQNPFLETVEIEKLYVLFLKENPKIILEKKQNCSDDFVIFEDLIFISCFTKYSECMYTNQFFEKQLKISGTARNWKTVSKLMTF